MRRFVFSILIAASLLLAVPGVFAQGRVTGNVAGHVTDPSGAAVPGAKITVTNTDTGVVYSSATDKAGYYLVRYLPIGTYDVAATQEGFKRIVHMGVLLDAGSTPTVDFKLTLGATAQSVTVSAAGALVEAQTADRGNVVDTVRLENFPAQTGNVFGLTFNTAGVQPTSSQKSYTFDDNSNASSISINGGQMAANQGYGGSNLTLYDGVYDRTNYGNHQGSGSVVGVIPSAQSVQQLKVVTSPYSAEYGQTTGGAIIAITKSGTNQFHGGGWYNQRDTALSATRFERNLAGQPKLPVKFWHGGGDIGGPIKKDKAFFYFEMQGVLSHTPTAYIGHVPTAAERNGDFSKTYYDNNGTPALQQIYNPFTVAYDSGTGHYTRQPFAGNIIPPEMINPVANSNFWNLIPLPNSTGTATGGNNYVPTTGGSPGDYQQEQVARVDWNVNQTNRLMFRFTRTSSVWGDIDFYPTAADPNANSKGGRMNQNAVMDYTKTFSPSTVLEVRTGFERYLNPSSLSHGCASPSILGFSSTFLSQAAGCFPAFSFGGSIRGSNYFSGAGTYSPESSIDQMNTIGGTLSKMMGRHTLKFGAFGLLERYYDAFPGYNSGLFGFSPSGSNLDPQVISPSSGNPTASFLLGVGSAAIQINSYPARQNKMYALYVQDDINVSPKLKLTMGLRWDKSTAVTDRFNAMVGPFDATATSPLAAAVADAAGASNCPACAHLVGGMTFPGVNGEPRTPYTLPDNNFGPRLGVAYSINSKTVVRAGWGLFYGPLVNDPSSAGFSQTTSSVLYNSNYYPINLIDNPFPDGIIQPTGAGNGLMTNVGTSVAFMAPIAKEQRSQQFSFDVQRVLPWKVLLGVGYVYNGVSRLPINRDINALTDAQVLLGASVLNNVVTNPFAGLVPGYSLNQPTIAYSQLIRPYPQFTSVTEERMPIGNMAYHGLQVQLNKRFSSGLSFSVAYTWSKHLGRYRYANAGDPIDQLQKSFDYFDMPNLFVVNEAWQLPIGRGRPIGTKMSGWMDAIVGGWMLNSNLRVESGAPYWLSPNAIPVSGVNKNAPNQSLNQWVNPLAFTQNTNPYSLVEWSQSFGSLRLPYLKNTDVQLEKWFNLTERIRLAVLTNWVNAFNTPQFWNSPGACNSPSSSCFGKIAGYQSQTNLPRQIQLGLKVTF